MVRSADDLVVSYKTPREATAALSGAHRDFAGLGLEPK
jgi:hypothetical protein